VGANRGSSYLSISQLVVRNLKGVNIAPLAKISQKYTTPALTERNETTYFATFAIDGNESVHTVPSIYVADPDKQPANNFVLEFNPPVCVSSIVYYGNNFNPKYNEGITFRLYNSNVDPVWTSSVSTQQEIQTFTVDPKTYDPK